MPDSTICAAERSGSADFERAQARLEKFVADKAKALDNGLDTVPAILDYLENGLPACVRLVTDREAADCQQSIQLLDAVQAELTAAVRGRHHLVDAEKLREVELSAALLTHEAYACLNAIEACLGSESSSAARFAVRTLATYTDRYDECINQLDPLPITGRLSNILADIHYYHAMVSFAKSSLGTHIDRLNARIPPSRLL